MMQTVFLFALILGVATLFAVRSGLVTISFNRKTYDGIVNDLRTKVTHLENLAAKEDQKAEDFLAEHLNLKALEAAARDVAYKARKTASNIGKLFA